MPGKSTADDHIRPLRMTVEKKVTVRRAGIEAYHALDDIWRDPLQEPRCQTHHVRFFIVSDVAIHMIGVRGIASTMVGNLDPRCPMDRETVNFAVDGVRNEDGKALWNVLRGSLHLQPPLHFTLNGQRQVELL